MANKSFLGNAYELSDVASYDGEAWVVFAVSEYNPEIFWLGPAFVNRLTSDSVPIESREGERRWLLPGVEIAIHRVDLSASQLLAKHPFSVVRISEEDSPLLAEEQTDESNLFDKLGLVAEAIEAKFHNSSEVAVPHLDDCVLDMIDSVKQSASFVWSHDRQRSYLLEHIRDTWTLRQRYTDPCAIEADIVVPLETGKGLVQFNSQGCSDLLIDQRAAIWAQFGLSFLTEAASPSQRTMEMARRTLRMILALPSSMAGGMNLVPTFSTTESQPDKPEHCLRQSIQIGVVGSGETLEVVCESYANHPQSVDLKVAVVNPKTLKAGAHVGVTLGSGGEDAPRVEVILADDRKGGLYGLGEFSMQWGKFVSYSTVDGLEVRIDLPRTEG